MKIDDLMKSKFEQDKSDWKKILSTSQNEADRDASNDKDNPILENSQFKKSKKKTTNNLFVNHKNSKA